MKLIVVNDYNEMSKKAANIIASYIVLKPDCVLGLATGSTPLGVYKELIKLYENGDVDFNQVCTFNLDEYYGITENNDQSYSYYMNENFFNHVNIKEENKFIPDGTCTDIETMCKKYDDIIKQHGGIDVQLLGIGQNSHIGFNEPDDKFVTDTHLVKLKEDTINANSRFFNTFEEVPKEAVSMGIKSIMEAKKILLIANGLNKAEAIFKALKGDITPKIPASILQLHSDVTVIIDKDAASKL